MSGGLSTLAFCWSIERRDGAGLALTSHDRDLVIGGRVYGARPGMLPAAIEKKLGLGETDTEVAGALTSAALSEADLLAGRWDGARVVLSLVNWTAPEDEPVELVSGELGEIVTSGGEFRAALNGAAAKLRAPACPETSPECRAELGDKRCRVDLAERVMVAKVVSAGTLSLTLDRAVAEDFLWGRVRLLDGANCGLDNALVATAGAEVTLRDRWPGAVLVGERVEFRHGCDKRFATCRNRFANAENFRGEPHLPGNDLLTRYPGQ